MPPRPTSTTALMKSPNSSAAAVRTSSSVMGAATSRIGIASDHKRIDPGPESTYHARKRSRKEDHRSMRFGIFGSAQAKRGGPDVDSGAGFKDFVEYNVQAETLGYEASFVVEHHFTGFGQISATLNLLTWIGARTSTLRLGTAVMVLPWHNQVLLAEKAAT